jgi:predicted PurR-regulated permease PerM
MEGVRHLRFWLLGLAAVLLAGFARGQATVCLILAGYHAQELALVVAVFSLGQFLEGHVLTPRLVGGRVGLHPVWVIFALLAGSTLFGFVGLLLAVPAAAVAGVLVRFAAARYCESRYYRGDPPWTSSPSS